MAVKENSTLPGSVELEHHNQNQFCVLLRTSFHLFFGGGGGIGFLHFCRGYSLLNLSQNNWAFLYRVKSLDKYTEQCFSLFCLLFLFFVFIFCCCFCFPKSIAILVGVHLVSE